MTNPKDSNAPHPDALSALQNLASGNAPTPQQRPEENPDASADPSVDASGFVGMLARGNTNEADPAGSATPPPMARRPMPKVSPKAVPSAPPRDNQLSAAIPVAREITPPPAGDEYAANEAAAEGSGTGLGESVEPNQDPHADEELDLQDTGYSAPAPAVAYRTPAGGRKRRRVPHWYNTAVPISFTMGALLAIVGMWALLAVLSSATGSKIAPGFNPAVDTVAMPLFLLLSLPVGIALEVMGVVMIKQLKRQHADDEAGR